MCDVWDSSGWDGYSEITGASGDSSTTLKGKAYYQSLTAKANTVPLTIIFKHYKIRVPQIQSTQICPFKHHKGGRENTGSFTYYHATNSFNCYGCKTGGNFAHAVEFVAAYEEITKAKAANKILNLFANDVGTTGALPEEENFSEQFEIMLDFSNSVRKFHQTHSDEKSFEYAEETCSAYDKMNMVHKLSNEAHRRIVDLFKKYLLSYK